MAALMRGKDSSRCLLLLAAVLMVESSQLGSSRAKLNSIKSSLGGETPAQAANRSAGTYQGLAFGGSKKGKNLGQVGKHSKYTLHPGEGGSSALERVALAPLDLPVGAPRAGAHNWGGDPRAGREGGGGWVAAGAGRRGALGLGFCLTFALRRGHVPRPSAYRCGKWPEWSFSKFNAAVQRMMLMANT